MIVNFLSSNDAETRLKSNSRICLFSQHDVDESVDIANVHLTVARDITQPLWRGVGGEASFAEHHIDYRIDIGDVHHAVAVCVASQRTVYLLVVDDIS